MRTAVALRRQHWWLTLIAACLVLAACHRSAPVNGEDPGWVERSDTRHKIAVVFVHGIFGSTRGTWTDAHGESFFRLLKNDATLGPQVDTYAFGFSSNIMTGGSLDIREAANKLQSYLQPSGVLDYPAIVFVGHSMGGLVIMRYLANNLDKAPALAEKVPLIVLFSAPMEGAQVAQLAGLVASNPALSNLRPVDSNDMLKQLSDDWASLAAKPRVSCAYETADVGGVRIVQWGSATRVCDGRPVAIDNADHISLVKPDRATHPAYMFLSGQLTEHVLPLQMSAQLELPDFQRDENSYIFTLGAPEENVRLMNTGRVHMKYWIGKKSSRSLLVSPGASPQLINGNSTELLTVTLRVDADENAYEFTLKSDLPSEQTVRVLVPDLSRLRTGHQRNAIKVTTGLAQYLGDPANAEKIAALQHDPDQLNAQLAAVAHAALGEPIKRLPSAEQWLLTADLLAAANLRSIASAALAQSAGIDAFYLQAEKELRDKLLAQGRAELLIRSDAMDWSHALPHAGHPDTPMPAAQEDQAPSMPAIPVWLDTVAYRESSLQLVRNMEKVASLRQDAASLEVATLKMSAEAATAKLQQVERQENATQMQIFQSPAAEAERQRRSEIERETRSRAQRIERPQLR
ncbi:alpha/beta hydrolase family protein [Janthinobacterium sp. HH104]|uniref:alpha/beta fold hydrolase n=1 Tax=Janthinobacterium sp. HH104 TaxID=1537276 RepID=UPI000892ACEA|nr:alpha/beta fold hydrolase [Janthinobacterium sp. HH104]OEZ86413.1 alpha/beta hydrolase family protein [Janthinobacterium sp. HH104]